MEKSAFDYRVGPILAAVALGGAVLYAMHWQAQQELQEQELVTLEQSISSAGMACAVDGGRACDDAAQACKRLMVEAPDKWAANRSCDQ